MISLKSSQMLRTKEQQEVAWRRVKGPKAGGHVVAGSGGSEGSAGAGLLGGVYKKILEKKRKPIAVIKHNNVSHKHNKSGKFLKNIYQSPVRTIISPNQPFLA